jgi:hypothetical protein
MSKIDLEGKSLSELDEIHEAVMRAKEKAAIEHQNDLIKQYQALRTELIKWGVVSEDKLPMLKARGWTRTVKAH